MALSIFQKLTLAFRGWSRRRAEKAARQNAEFLSRATAWSPKLEKPAAPGVLSFVTPGAAIDREGLQVAFLDDSQRMAYFLELRTGEVIEVLAADTASVEHHLASPTHWRRVPCRTEESEADDRETFAHGVERAELRARLLTALHQSDPGTAFRRVLAGDRSTERAWYNFKNDRANEVIEAWLAEVGSLEPRPPPHK